MNEAEAGGCIGNYINNGNKSHSTGMIGDGRVEFVRASCWRKLPFP